MNISKEEAAACRESAKLYLANFNKGRKNAEKCMALLKKACMGKDPEAMFLMGKLMIEKYCKTDNEDAMEMGMKMLYYASSYGSLQANVMLNEICGQKYDATFPQTEHKEPHPLTDFDGKPIKIHRTGFFTPIDAILEYVEGRNILTFKTNISFTNAEDSKDPEAFKAAVCAGIKAWEGDYVVFGGQKLTVKIDLTTDSKLFDTIDVYLMTAELMSAIKQIGQIITGLGNDTVENRIDFIAKEQASFTALGRKWTIHSQKSISITQDETADNCYEQIEALAKHEFGHALGLGDLYHNPKLGLKGIAHNTYQELDSYYISDYFYHLVMCECHGPISNNDIEMIVLAFSKNAMQNYQPQHKISKVSEALGNGN